MSSTAFERALAAACQSPLGPLALSHRPGAGDTWLIDAAWRDAGRAEIQAHCDGRDVSLLVAVRAEVGESTLRALPWVVEAVPSPVGGSQARLWLRSDDLSANTLLAAVTSLIGVAALTPAPPEPEAGPPADAEPVRPATAVDETVALPAEETTVLVAPADDLAAVAEPTLVEQAPASQPDASEAALSEAPADPPALEASPPAPAAVPPPQEAPPLAAAAEPEEPLPAWQRLDALLTPPPAEPEPEPETETEPEPAVEVESSPAPEPDPSTSAPPGDRCPECGEPHPPNHAFCIHCGARLT